MPKITLNGSWKTTAFGTSGLLVVIGNVMNMLLDDDPKTNPDWSVYLPLIISLIANMISKDTNITHAPHPTRKGKPV
jgi:hypothetical protein